MAVVFRSGFLVYFQSGSVSLALSWAAPLMSAGGVTEVRLPALILGKSIFTPETQSREYAKKLSFKKMKS